MMPLDLREFLNRHSMSEQAFAAVVGVTRAAVNHWACGKRTIPLTISRLCKTFDRYPGLLLEFGKVS